MELTYEYKGKKFDYEVCPTIDDIIDYLTPSYTKFSEEELNAYQFGTRKVISQNWFDIEKIEKDEFFIKYMKEKYEADAIAFYKENYEED